MSFVSSLFSGSQGAGFQAQGANANQLNANQTQAEGDVAQQQQFLSSLAAQGGAQNQTNVFNQQQQLANQLQQQAAGGGPNPALQQLQNTTGQNVANQAALAAGQRGAGANAGLIARQVGQQGAATQQQAVGQGAQMAAQQQLNAQGALANQQANQANLATQQVGQQGNTLQNIAGNNQALLGSDVSSLASQNSANASIAQGNQAAQAGILKGVASAGAGAVGLADGGKVQTPDAPAQQTTNGAKSNAGQWLSNAINPPAPSANGDTQADLGSRIGAGIHNAFTSGSSASSSNSPISSIVGGGDAVNPMDAMMAKGGPVKAMVSPGEVYIPPSKVAAAAKSKNPAKEGERIPGKAKVKGDSLKNDTVPKTLEEGGIVLPKSVMEHKHPAWAAHKFVTAITAKTKLRKK
jgi:hypothetical protein